ncbi:protein arginine N-methyltransferase 5 [Cylas formicarius]|uniref:protein arginine N-methyltransferase 5 n=1 Tax=Cylas formicarius TaxID=197179 RepID=UPI002958A87A|nr:protein arginine N-methyltransferase 5 [Cylas formicarius]
MDGGDQSGEKRKQISCGLYSSCPASLKAALHSAFDYGFHFIVTQITHPNYTRDLNKPDSPFFIGRTDRVLKATEWNRLIVGELTTNIDVDSEIEHVRRVSKNTLKQELGFAIHLGIPAVLLHLCKPDNVHLARIVNSHLVSNSCFAVWVQVPLVHPSRTSPISDKDIDSWEWWNNFRIHCDYDKRVGVVLEMPDISSIPSTEELDRWIGEPVKALVIPTSYFLTNQYGKPVLSKAHQEIIRRFITIDVQYIIHLDTEADFFMYVKYMNFLGKKLYSCDIMAEFVQGCEDYLQCPLQPLTEHLETNVYEVFEKDQVKYDVYQKAIYDALQEWTEERNPVIMVVGAGRGPLVQAVLNVSVLLNREVKLYAIEKNPYAVNTLAERVRREWGSDKVTLVKTDMRSWKPPEKADILVSELLGSFGDNELSPECLDGAQRLLCPRKGVSIPASYTSYLAPLQSIKIYNEIRANRPSDKTLRQVFETPYVVHLANYQQLAPAQALFTFEHPNFAAYIDNRRRKRLRFGPVRQACVLTSFAGFFEAYLYGNVVLSTNPSTHTPDMVSWFPIVFPLAEPVQLRAGDVVQVSFWREESTDRVWYEWCLELPLRSSIMNPNGRSYHIKKH